MGLLIKYNLGELLRLFYYLIVMKEYIWWVLKSCS